MKFLKRLADASTWGLENQNSYLLRRHDVFSAKLEGGEKKKKSGINIRSQETIVYGFPSNCKYIF